MAPGTRRDKSPGGLERTLGPFCWLRQREERAMKRWKGLVLALAVLVGAVALSACGGSDDESSSSGGPAIKLGFSAWPGWFPWQVAEEAGIFKQAGVKVELVWFEGYLDSINAL